MITVFENILENIKENRKAVFAIITGRVGSVPRGVGTCMLTGAEGIICGTVGGGQVEYKSMLFSQEMIERNIAFDSKKFDLEIGTKSKDSLDMVCGGSVEIKFFLINPNDDAWKEVAEKATASLTAGKKDYLLIDEDNRLAIWDENNFDKEKALNLSFIMPLPVKERVIIFGGGHVATALVPLVASVGFQCILFECREDFVKKGNYPMADEIIIGDYEKVDDYLDLKPSDYLVIMTHDHAFDLEIEKQLLSRAFAYVGVMGSRRKKATVAAKLKEAGISDEAIGKVHTPIGLAIGGQLPEEIAISIVAELIQVRAERQKLINRTEV